ncbi:MAG: light-harvesting protein [Rhizobacter sp.]
MNQGKIWRVVNPTVGVPIFLGSVVIASLVVHGGLMINTEWFGSYWNGGHKAAAAAAAKPAAALAPDTVVSQAPSPQK